MRGLTCCNCRCEITGSVVWLVDTDRPYCSEACLDEDIEQPAAD